MRDDIKQKVEELRAEKGDVISIDEIGHIVEGILDSLRGDINGTDVQLYHEVQELARYIEAAKQEIAQIKPSDIKDEHLQVATDELDAIVAHTEEATGTILDAAEKLENLAGNSDEATSAAITEVVTNIYEACNFQDITGQRITRVVSALKDIETKVMALASTFGENIGSDPQPRPEKKKAVNGESKASDKDLLNGPQLPDSAQSQEDIDALLASFD